MQYAIYDGPCVYCGKPIGLIMPYSTEGVLIYKGRKLLGLAHRRCNNAEEQKKAGNK